MNKISGQELDCLFIFSPGGGNGSDSFLYNIGNAYIIAFLKKHGYYTSTYISRESVRLEKCVREIISLNPGIIGFTVYNTNFLTSVLIAEHIKKDFPRKIIVLGGPTATSYHDFILERYPFIDICFRNESEETFLQFLSGLKQNKFDLRETDLCSIKGISFRLGNRIIVNPDCNNLADNSKCPDYLDKYPSPYLCGVIPGSDAFATGILTARGCNQHCVYCNCAGLSNNRISTHSIERVISELDYLSGFSDNNKVLSFYDDAFSLIPQRAKAICRAIIENRIRMPLSCITRCDHADEELLDLMKEAGFVSIAFSLESANPKTLRVLGKVHKPEDDPSDTLEKERVFIERFGKMAAYAKKTGIKTVFASIMTGLPFETLEEANKTIEKIDSCPGIDSCSQNILTVYHGTPLFNSYKKYGYKLDIPDNNPIFSKTIYPGEVVSNVKVSAKSHFHEIHRSVHGNTLKILSMAYDKNNRKEWFSNIILISDTINREFVDWMKMILALNGTMIQIYSDEQAFFSNHETNYENFIRYRTPSLDVRNYYFKKSGDLLLICSHSPFVRTENDRNVITICDFKYVKANLTNAEVSFLKVMCKESDSEDSLLAYSYLNEINEGKDLFASMINRKPYPYFSNLCRWTRDLSNCNKKNTVFVNNMGEVRLCWYGPDIGKVGQSREDIVSNLEFFQELTSERRNCKACTAGDRCVRCVSPFPLSDEDYCIRQKRNDMSKVAEMLICIDTIKQFIN